MIDFKLLIEKALKLGFSDVEIVEKSSKALEVSLFRSVVDQNVLSEDNSISIRAMYNDKMANMSIENFDCDLDEMFAYIGGIIKGVKGLPIEIGGRSDHLHILTSLPKTMSVSEFVRVLKSNSSKWIKTKNIRYNTFEWQEGYGAFSVSPSLLDKTINYIRNQEEHHKKRNAKDEYMMFLDAYKVEYDERYLIDD